ncbi:putative pyruvate, phosphate dikinase [Gordonia paraffinivorans NBRC 108238]|uniref:Pyruvate, phosphate dikinase n=1 Tax=Gordonia paraffinivorans NBRC 108238 TaxID=1223543 RepID=A0ABQ0IM25_9ACTN|nr:PEP/pyruvate-binding domain-containing protein [Gordonia paraffinivorans]GAC84619.1 putative pyruvate, phosphate dikinase [Gordonia paraffinivorans NBRC 108238]
MTTVSPKSTTTTTSASPAGVTGLDSAVFHFDHPHDLPHEDLVALLGGKGAGLAEMSTGLGINVPPGFTVSVPVCRAYLEHGRPAGLTETLARFVGELGERMGRNLGDPADPLLVAVRSGAPVSMPGMLDTVLNLGLNDETVEGLAAVSGSADFAWDSYRRFVTMYAVTVMGVDGGELAAAAVQNGGGIEEHVRDLKRAVEQLAGRPVPTDPFEQLTEAVEAVFKSWHSPRAQTYRERENIDPALGTAVTVQAMVFGNRGELSGTGVVFTRNPSTGADELYGDYLPMAQGEDVVAGTAKTLCISKLAELHPEIYAELRETLRRLEIRFRDMCDVEFTIEEGRLWLLQTRPGKRGAAAAVRIAAALAQDPEISLTPAEIAERVPEGLRERARAEALAHVADETGMPPVVTKALGASPGRAVGRAVLTTDAAAEAEDDVILVRPETSPEDVAGMAASVGLLTTNGGLVSHAAVVARGWGIPAVVGAHDLRFDSHGLISTDGTRIRAGDLITIDGSTGCVWLGAVTPPPADVVNRAVEHDLPELLLIERLLEEHAKNGEN